MNFSKRNHRLVCAAAMCAVTAFGFAPSANAATTYYVDGSSGSDSNSGILWSQAYATLYKALSVADGNSGDDIWVAKGTYYPDDGTGDPDNQSLSFDMVAKVPVYGGFLNGDDFGDRDIVANETILSGAIGTGAQNDNSNHVVTFENLTDTAAVLDGFTVSDGYANGNDLAGGGIFVRQTDSSIIRNCTLKDNFALDHGGGVGVSTIQSTDVVRVQNCRFEGNSSNAGGGIGSKIAPGTINVINCDFSANVAFTRGGGLHGSGGTVNVVNTTFTGNSASQPNGLADGGGADFQTGSDAVLINCLFESNTADDLGGAVYVTGSATTVEFVNCTLSDNDADYEGGGIVGDNSSTITITNGILWGNTDGGAGTDTEEEQLHVLNGASATVTYTCIEELETYSPGTGNTDDDPLFVAPGSNYRLAAASLLIDAGDDDAVLCDEFDVDEDGEDCTAPAQDTPDLDFGVRIADGDGDSFADVDMGAYESCPWDLDTDCKVGVGDLLILLANWENPYGVPEMLLLLAAWGPCPCDPDADVLSLAEELADACLTQDDWDEYEDVMTDPESSQEDKDRYDCWMTHYMMHCDKCTCEDIPTCPTPDPFN